MNREEIEERLWETLPGPWSWRNLMDHMALCVAYGIVRAPYMNKEHQALSITNHIRNQALRIVEDEDDR